MGYSEATVAIQTTPVYSCIHHNTNVVAAAVVTAVISAAAVETVGPVYISYSVL